MHPLMVTADQDGQEIESVTFIRESDGSPDELPETIIDRYTAWASKITDAPPQYHRVSGAVILSTIICPHVSLETSFGSIRPNIWAMILAGTTLTRKSTSMSIANQMMSDVLDDHMLATDGSPEGIFSELALRNERVSVFHRDEITGFITSVTSRDYLSGLLESFTQLYDGTEQKRVLRGQSIVIKNPYFVFYCGGIKTRMEELVGMEHIRSGFLPRFIFVTGTTTSDQIRPIGPPEKEAQRTDGNAPRDAIVDELWRINKYYTEPPPDPAKTLSVKVGGLTRAVAPVQSPGPVHHQMEATDEAWTRIRALHYDAMTLGENSSAPELYTPLFARLADSVIKVAILLGAADLKPVVELHHVQNAIRFSQEWLDSLMDFAGRIEQAPEMDKWERKIDKIVSYVRSKHPNEVTRTEVSQKFRIRTKDMVDIENTMRDRRLVEIVREKHRDGNTRNTDGYRYWYVIPRGQLDPDPATGKRPTNPIEREDSYRVTKKEDGHAQPQTVRKKRYRASNDQSTNDDNDND